MRTLFLTTFLTLSTFTSLLAQPIAPPGSRLQFDIQGPSLVEVQAYTYRQYFDGSGVGQVFAVTCQDGGSVGTYVCTSNTALPALPIGPHSVQVSAANAAGEGQRSNTFQFSIIATPNAPTSIRLV